MSQERILITGASGQIGTELAYALAERHGHDRIVATDIKSHAFDGITFVMMDILNVQRVAEIIEDYGITQMYHLAAILSASGEWNPRKTWNVNLNAVLRLFEACLEKGVRKVFFPSTIAIFGGPTPKANTPQHSPAIPSTVYGISKLTGELWCNYYYHRYGLDVRSIRYPGIISHGTLSGGGTTDYAVEIFYAALRDGRYTCFLKPDTRLPMIYMDDAIRGTLELMDAPAEQISIRTSYNLSGMDFTPAELTEAIRRHLPDFEITYSPDHRQAIADSWTASIDDTAARQDWGWKPEFTLESMVAEMIGALRDKGVG